MQTMFSQKQDNFSFSIFNHPQLADVFLTCIQAAAVLILHTTIKVHSPLVLW